jgi:stress responsive alpha/beta barrel protein
MLVHLVSFKYKPGVDEAVRKDHRERLRALAHLDGIFDLRVGGDVVGSARSYDTGLVILFPDRAALDAYQKNPSHVAVAQFGAANCESIVAVDFESQ